MKVFLANPRGFCAGVDRAIDIVKLALKRFNRVYVRHEIVHNHHVVSDLVKRGAIFVEDLDEVPPGSIIIFSAHGVSSEVKQKAIAQGFKVIDATCPLVTKVHLEAIKYAKEGLHIFLIGHKQHVEVVGTWGEAPESITVVETLADIEKAHVPDPDRVAVLTQTTLSLDDTEQMIAALKKRFPNIRQPRANDICYATTNRQDTVKLMAKCCDTILVVGSATSSNSNRLMEVAKSCGVRSFLIDDETQITAEMLQGVENLGLTAGASAPELLLQSILAWLKERYGSFEIEEIGNAGQNVSFMLPKELVELQDQK
ncbi:MAG: 4-hydroxy-3-methylbut-2-enyl diphosphate reductase [bacterium]|nr:4-hydroxy-3-methylbut-2-enyl diphosphate reductase [bacterium]